SLLVTYDALGRAVEQQSGSTYTPIVYSPQGERISFMSGQTFQRGRVPLVGGSWARYTSSGLSLYRHADWLGSSRLASYPTGSNRIYEDVAYAPYGEAYAYLQSDRA